MAEAGNQFAQTPDKVAWPLHKVAWRSGQFAEAFCHVAGSLGKFDGEVCNVAEPSGNVAETCRNVAEVSGNVAEVFCNVAEAFCNIAEASSKVAERTNKFVLFQK